jgi:DNA-binding NtrC family response regulator
VEPTHLPLHVKEPTTPIIGGSERLGAAKHRFISDFERQAIVRMLADARGNVSAAARRAGTTRRNFHRLLAKYHIDPAHFRDETVASQIRDLGVSRAS